MFKGVLKSILHKNHSVFRYFVNIAHQKFGVGASLFLNFGKKQEYLVSLLLFGLGISIFHFSISPSQLSIFLNFLPDPGLGQRLNKTFISKKKERKNMKYCASCRFLNS